MRKVIAAFNTTLDAISDHTAGIPDEEIHRHYTELIHEAGVMLYGRTTFQLMEYWRTVLADPSDKKSMNDFARAINEIPKIVFSRTLKSVDWPTATITTRDLEDEVLHLRQQPGHDILVGSRSLIMQLLKLNLIDEFQLCIHPVVARNGSPLFEKGNERTLFKLIKTKSFSGGAVILYYQPEK